MEDFKFLRTEIKHNKSIKNCFEKFSAIHFKPMKDTNTLKDFYFGLVGNLVRKLLVTPDKFNNNSIDQYYMNAEKN